jgi:cellulose synthase/poly-beta-1,6-N-acetylglucosamine synthase-like glycosyltransferase
MMGGIIAVVLLLAIQAVRWVREAPNKCLGADVPYSIPNLGPYRISFLVPVWNDEQHVTPFVQSFQALTGSGKNLELVLCAGGTDGTGPAARSHIARNVAVISQEPGDGKQGALAKALVRATGDVVFLTDIDCRPRDESVYPVISHVLENPHEIATGGVSPLSSQKKSNFVIAQWAVRERSNPSDGDEIFGVDGRNTAMMREVLARTRAFNVPAPSGTDYTLGKELTQHGYPIRFVGSSRMETVFPEDMTTYVAKQARWLRNVIMIGIRYRSYGEAAAAGQTLLFPFATLALFLGGVWFAPLLWAAFLLVLFSLTNRVLYLRGIGRPAAAAGTVVLLLADWAASTLTVRHLYRRHTGWS